MEQAKSFIRGGEKALFPIFSVLIVRIKVRKFEGAYQMQRRKRARIYICNTYTVKRGSVGVYVCIYNVHAYDAMYTLIFYEVEFTSHMIMK